MKSQKSKGNLTLKQAQKLAPNLKKKTKAPHRQLPQQIKELKGAPIGSLIIDLYENGHTSYMKLINNHSISNDRMVGILELTKYSYCKMAKVIPA